MNLLFIIFSYLCSHLIRLFFYIADVKRYAPTLSYCHWHFLHHVLEIPSWTKPLPCVLLLDNETVSMQAVEPPGEEKLHHKYQVMDPTYFFLCHQLNWTISPLPSSSVFSEESVSLMGLSGRKQKVEFSKSVGRFWMKWANSSFGLLDEIIKRRRQMFLEMKR